MIVKYLATNEIVCILFRRLKADFVKWVLVLLVSSGIIYFISTVFLIQFKLTKSYNRYQQSGGWRCGGGAHWVTDSELQRNYTFDIDS